MKVLEFSSRSALSLLCLNADTVLLLKGTRHSAVSIVARPWDRRSTNRGSIPVTGSHFCVLETVQRGSAASAAYCSRR